MSRQAESRAEMSMKRPWTMSRSAAAQTWPKQKPPPCSRHASSTTILQQVAECNNNLNYYRAAADEFGFFVYLSTYSVRLFCASLQLRASRLMFYVI